MQLAAQKSIAAAGSFFQGIGAYQQGNYQKNLAYRNADIVNQQAGARSEADTRGGEKAVGAAAARAGASGFDLSGSAADIMAQLAGESSQRARTSIYEGNVRAESYRERGDAAAASGRAALLGGIGKVTGLGTQLLLSTTGKFKYKGP